MPILHEKCIGNTLPILALKIMAHTNTDISSHTFEHNLDNLFNQSQKVKYNYNKFLLKI